MLMDALGLTKENAMNTIIGHPLEQGEHYYSLLTDLPLDFSTMRNVHRNVDTDDLGFWTHADCNDTSGRPHKIKFAAVPNRHLSELSGNTEPLASTVIYIKTDC